MSAHYLLCNEIKCHTELKTQAWVTFCSHIFCMEHGRIAVSKQKCLNCETKFGNKYDIVVMDLNPSEQYKTMLLAGLSPEKVLDIAGKGISFWMYQMYQEKILRDTAVRNAEQQYAEVVEYYENLNSTHTLEMKKLQREKNIYLKDIEDKSKKIDELVTQLAESTRLTKQQQMQIESLKCTLSDYKQLAEKNDREKNLKFDFNRVTSPQSSNTNKKKTNFYFNPVKFSTPTSSNRHFSFE